MGLAASDAAGLSIEKRHDDRLWIFTFTNNSHEIIDTWVDQVRAYRKLQPDANARYLVYDGSAVRGLSFDPYLRLRSTEITEDDPHATGRVAVVVNVMPGVRHIMQLFVWMVSRRAQPNLGVHIFDKREAAIAWVEQAYHAGNSS